MSIPLRILLIVGSILAFIYILRKIRKCDLEISDSVFWFIFAAVLIIIAVFPQIIIVPSQWIGIDSPANFLFLVIICVLMINQFMMVIKIGQLRTRLKSLAQEIALTMQMEEAVEETTANVVEKN